ncbi:glycoside hydrolase family 3 N-terminal domain-containing protein [Acidicapsa acidisoli]|uniref:glycoside hydrolase family 3 N-terminal domain-containing protein n=1 Tax=Acidicapsa acidisoli TaxID=1615681 RepID=UPI0021E01CC5|nr:glycoside hydrolase family 3 N-terminal domain-containing protein [Acidicapsa acidisoli]
MADKMNVQSGYGFTSHQRRGEHGSLIRRASLLLMMRKPDLSARRVAEIQFRTHLASALAVLSIACLAAAHPVLAWAQGAVPPTDSNALYKQPGAPIDRRVDDLLSRMTLEEKVRQLDLYSGATALVDQHKDDTHATSAAHFLPDKAQEMWGDLGVGAIHDLNPTPEQANTIQQWVLAHNRLGIPALFIEEGLHGFDTGTVFPAPIGLAATWNPGIVQKVGAAIAAEARATGVGMILGPVLDLAREPRWGRVEEDYGEDPYLTGQLGLAYVQGAHGDSLSSDHSVVAEPKHFAGHGSPEGGTNTSPVHIGERELRSVMLKSFEPAIRDGKAMGVMAAYHEIDGIPITADPFLLKKILRQEWGFQGFVLSDLGAIQRLYNVHHVAATPKDAVCLGIKSGVDMQFYDFEHEVFQKSLMDCVHEGSLSPSDLDRAVRSVLRVKFALGLFDHPLIDPGLRARTYRSQAHLDLTLEAARKSMTLLKNDGHLLPLSKSTKKIAVIGPNADVAQYGDYENESNGAHISILAGIRALVPQAAIEFDAGKDIAAAVAKAKDADVVILGLGERQGISGEGFDRTDLGLPGNQEQLLEAVVGAGKPVVLVLENGRPLTIGWAKEHVPAILEAWYPGEFGGRAIAETLFGDNNPAGRLTITFPRSLGQLPDFYNFDPSRTHKYVDDDGAPLFPFGFGLSYTSFHYDHLAVQTPSPGSNGDVVVTVDVTNDGDRPGEEVAQLYVRQDVGSVETPDRSLKGFSRIVLNPRETKNVTFRLPQGQLAVWDTENKWTVEAGQYTLWVGGSSQASLTTKFVIHR